MGILASATLALAVVSGVPASAQADECGARRRPASFDQTTAMEAIFCEYDRKRAGTLLPIEHTASWDLSKAETLASPLLVAVYRESNVERGVLVVQRQLIVDGEPASGHAQPAVVSVYIFQRSGGRWALEKSEEEALEEGHNGNAPGARLVKLGPNRFGLWFSSGDIHQGYTTSSAVLVTLSETRIAEVGRFNLGESNVGACSDDPKERGGGIYACWDYEGDPAFIAAGGEYYLLRIAYKGTAWLEENTNRIGKKNQSMCFAKGARDYAEIKDPKCDSYKPLPDRDVFPAGMR